MKGHGKVPNELTWKDEQAFDTEVGDRNPSRGNAMKVKMNQGSVWAPVEPCLWHTYCGPKLSKMVATV